MPEVTEHIQVELKVLFFCRDGVLYFRVFQTLPFEYGDCLEVLNLKRRIMKKEVGCHGVLMPNVELHAFAQDRRIDELGLSITEA
jgi:hypothetical protein